MFNAVVYNFISLSLASLQVQRSPSIRRRRRHRRHRRRRGNRLCSSRTVFVAAWLLTCRRFVLSWLAVHSRHFHYFQLFEMCLFECHVDDLWAFAFICLCILCIQMADVLVFTIHLIKFTVCFVSSVSTNRRRSATRARSHALILLLFFMSFTRFRSVPIG